MVTSARGCFCDTTTHMVTPPPVNIALPPNSTQLVPSPTRTLPVFHFCSSHLEPKDAATIAPAHHLQQRKHEVKQCMHHMGGQGYNKAKASAGEVLEKQPDNYMVQQHSDKDPLQVLHLCLVSPALRVGQQPAGSCGMHARWNGYVVSCQC